MSPFRRRISPLPSAADLSSPFFGMPFFSPNDLVLSLLATDRARVASPGATFPSLAGLLVCPTLTPPQDFFPGCFFFEGVR